MKKILFAGAMVCFSVVAAVHGASPECDNMGYEVRLKELRSASDPEAAIAASAAMTDLIVGMTSSLIVNLNVGNISRESIGETCFLLGLLRAGRAAESMASHIDLELRATEVRKSGELTSLPRWVSHPCREGLVKIGRPAVPVVMELIRLGDSGEVRELAVRTIREIEGGESCRVILGEAADGASGVERERLNKALQLCLNLHQR